MNVMRQKPEANYNNLHERQVSLFLQFILHFIVAPKPGFYFLFEGRIKLRTDADFAHFDNHF